MIKYNSQPCLKIKDLWQALHKSFNIAQHRQVDTSILEEFPNKTIFTFSKEEFVSAIKKYSNNSTPRPDKLLWRHLKEILKNSVCFDNVLNIANAYIDLEYWPSHFKVFMSIIIPKPNKISYNVPKIFRPIVLLNMLGKLIEKVVSKRLQFQALSNNLIHPCQLGGFKQQFMTDAGILSDVVHTGDESLRKWTQRYVNLWNDLSFSLCAVLSVYCMVAISNNKKKSKMGVNANLVYYC